MSPSASAQTASWREVQEVISECGDAYRNETKQLQEREEDAARVLQTINDQMNRHERELKQYGIPACVQQTDNAVTLSIGSKEGIAGEIKVERMPGGNLKVVRSRCRAGVPPDEQSQTRSPDDFGAPHLQREFVDAYKWIFRLVV